MLQNKIQVKHKREVVEDTIVAKATPSGVGGVGIIRISGTLAFTIANRMLETKGQRSKTITPRVAEYLSFLDTEGQVIDQGIALFFKGPHSFTGEDVLELQGHGGPIVMDKLVQNVISHGARLARPGEFLERAFLNNKIDLVQAEAIHDLIHATSESAARAAMRSLQGEFSNKINTLLELLISLRMFVEASIDFPDEELELLQEGEVAKRLEHLKLSLEDLEREAARGAILSEGLRVVLAGRPNAGKSSLLNRLSGQDVAIVTDIPGTTRDVLRQEISIDGLRLQLVDTAGLREAGDIIEQEGMKRAGIELGLADHIILVVDATLTEERDPSILLPELQPFLNMGIRTTVLRNKIDVIKENKPKNMNESNMNEENSLTGTTGSRAQSDNNWTVMDVSVKTGTGMADFIDHLKKTAGFVAGEGNFTARRRHLEALRVALNHIQASAIQLKEKRGFELVAEELRLAQLALDEITGRFTSDDLLGKIFSEFCIGK